MAKQNVTGKAFEYALLYESYAKLNILTRVNIVENSSYQIAKKCFESFNEDEQGIYLISSSAAINFLLDVEPKLKNGIIEKDVLQLEIASDKQGQSGDVRDVLLMRSVQNWEIGISAKNNHRAVKHSRLSQKIDFGRKWLGFPCSQDYFEEIKPVFTNLSDIKKKDKLTRWESIENMHLVVYVPILRAFQKELIRLDEQNPGVVASNLVQYLIGNQDFYKIIKGEKNVEIQAFNLNGSLNLPFHDIKPKLRIPRLKLPSRLIEVVFEKDSNTTLLVSLDQGWQISLRIHSASSRVEPSLKFDIKLISVPHTLFTNHISV